MRLAIITDVHGDIHALRDALAHAERLACDQVVCAGDLIDHGLFPEDTIALIRERCIPTIRGNHDHWAIQDPGRALAWDLSDEAVSFLRELPTSWRLRIGDLRVAMHHARPGSDMVGIYPDIPEDDAAALLEADDCDVLIVGHTHLAFERFVTGGRLLVNPGCLLRDSAEPMQVPPLGTFGVLELPAMTFTVYFSRTGEVFKHQRGSPNGSEPSAQPSGFERAPGSLLYMPVKGS